jgi:hypothetical protein
VIATIRVGVQSCADNAIDAMQSRNRHIGAAFEEIVGRESGGAEACGYGFGDWRGGSGGAGGFDFD